MRKSNLKLSPEEKEALKGRIFDQLGLSQPDMPERETRTVGQTLVKRWLAAAAVVVLFSVPVYFLIRQKTAFVGQPFTADIVVKTAAGETRRVLLPDSSVVLLNAASVLSWPASFLSDPARQVTLSGNAFFSVRKRPQQKTFTVHAASLAIAVIGTEFNVNSRSAATEVALLRGKVNVSRPGKAGPEAVLRPGEKILLDTASSTLIRSVLNSDAYSAWTDNKWNFNRTRLDDILQQVQAYYGVQPVFENERHRGLKITASITVGRLVDLVTVLENTLQIRIKTENNQLLVQ